MNIIYILKMEQKQILLNKIKNKDQETMARTKFTKEIVITLCVFGHGNIFFDMFLPENVKDNTVVYPVAGPGLASWYPDPVNVCNNDPNDPRYYEPEASINDACTITEKMTLSQLRMHYAEYMNSNPTSYSTHTIMKLFLEKYFKKYSPFNTDDNEKRERDEYREHLISEAGKSIIPNYDKIYNFSHFPESGKYFMGVYILDIAIRVGIIYDNEEIKVNYFRRPQLEDIKPNYKNINLIYKNGQLDYIMFLKNAFPILYPEYINDSEKKNEYFRQYNQFEDFIYNGSIIFQLDSGTKFNRLKKITLNEIYTICCQFGKFNKMNIIDFTCNMCGVRGSSRVVGTLAVKREFEEGEERARKRVKWGGTKWGGTKNRKRKKKNYKQNNIKK